MVEDKTIFSGIIYEADVPNANGHVYPRKVLENMVRDANDNQKFVLGRTGDIDYSKPAVILVDVSHECYKFRFAKNCVVCDCMAFDTPSGKRLIEMLECGNNDLMLNPCCTAKLDGNIVTDAKLLSVDIVCGNDYPGRVIELVRYSPGKRESG